MRKLIGTHWPVLASTFIAVEATPLGVENDVVRWLARRPRSRISWPRRIRVGWRDDIRKIGCGSWLSQGFEAWHTSMDDHMATVQRVRKWILSTKVYGKDLMLSSYILPLWMLQEYWRAKHNSNWKALMQNRQYSIRNIGRSNGALAER